jgi:hypothetical protein
MMRSQRGIIANIALQAIATDPPRELHSGPDRYSKHYSEIP